jgi:predicted RecB family nuclease
MQEFEKFLIKIEPTKSIEETTDEDLEEFVIWSKVEDKNTNTCLWAIAHYFTFLSIEELAKKASQLRKSEIKRQPLSLKEIRGLLVGDIDKLAKVGIGNVKELLEATKTPKLRSELSTSSRVPADTLLELVKLADLCRIPGVKGIRARLYFDAGVDTLEKLAQWDPLELREMLLDYVAATNFDGVAPWLKEAKFTVETAQKLPKILEF